jgi:hypothetical protein
MVGRPWRTIIVATFALFLVVQGYFSFAIKPEPYPSIRMPNFGTAAAKDGTYIVPLARVDIVNQDGSIQPVSATEIMEGFRFSTARPSYDYMFLSSDPSKIPPSVKVWLRERIHEINADSRPVELKMCWQKSAVSVFDASIVRSEPCTWKIIQL